MLPVSASLPSPPLSRSLTLLALASVAASGYTCWGWVDFVFGNKGGAKSHVFIERLWVSWRRGGGGARTTRLKTCTCARKSLVIAAGDRLSYCCPGCPTEKKRQTKAFPDRDIRLKDTRGSAALLL